MFFHWLKLRVFVMLLLIRSRMPLLTLPILDFVGLISLQVGLFVKFGLWSLSVMNASLLAVVSTLSSIPNFVAMSLFCLWMACVVSYIHIYLFPYSVSRPNQPPNNKPKNN